MKINKSLSGIALAIAVVTHAWANPQVQWDWSHYSTSGNYSIAPNAELLQQISASSYVNGLTTDGTWLGTFCLEINEDTVGGGVYDAALSNRSIQGGLSSPTPGYDIISVGTAYLYSEFVQGTLGGFNYNDPTSSWLLNEVIWFLEGEMVDQNVEVFNSQLIAKFGSLDAAKADYTGGAVQVLNLTSRDEKGNIIYNQDQLVYVPEGGLTAMMLGLGLLSLAFAKRRL